MRSDSLCNVYVPFWFRRELSAQSYLLFFLKERRELSAQSYLCSSGGRRDMPERCLPESLEEKICLKDVSLRA